MRSCLIDTISLNHSLKAVGRRLNYESFRFFLQAELGDLEFKFFADEESSGFITYLEKLEFEKRIFTKKAYKKKISDTTKIWYLSFAVDISLEFKAGDIVVSNDLELLPLFKHRPVYKLYGLGIPLLLREHADWENLPDVCLI
jgi:hypothetical protein